MISENETRPIVAEKQGEYNVLIYREEDIPWEVHNQIHRLLNIAFKGKSIKFITKTYANIRPLARVLCFRGGELVGHTGINEDVMYVGDLALNIGCLGLTAAANHNKGIAIKALNFGADYLRNKGYDLALGISNSPGMLKYIIPECNAIDFPVSVIGKTTSSKPTDHAILFSLRMSKEELEQFKDKVLEAGEIKLEGEIF